ncbi:putative NAD dependent epimerase/dehydratase [Aspergillus steynii IBT 23096]|uniref:Putative NAD dependent epimerase/dehydratase n=1 Tax=Aspergillus steynii IBT 23096 TaxID=1392250 RepID=A0A2I2GLX7_9EURO|nr:putative NAD dependent epimerase/dehydratase [Aspergillus steynii IBT 23096]PLB53874.1 putative NAD dependent epimerase/dehydratase [Aspergillus steynii IBT 23096]
MPSPTPTPRTALVTGANGYIGNAVCRAFVRAGWTVYGLTRKTESIPSLAREEIIPILGSPGDLAFLPTLLSQQKAFDAIISTTESLYDYESHFAEIMALLHSLSSSNNASGIRPLVLFTSGCKDYGMTARADSPNLAPHTESSPLNPPDVLSPRTYTSLKVFDDEHKAAFDAVLLRPTTVFGRSGSFYGPFFDMAQAAKEGDGVLRLPAHRESVVHGTHVDDCADAYVAIAERDRTVVAGQIYNISGWRYETLAEVGEALVQEYGLQGVVYEPPATEGFVGFDVIGVLTGFSQWVGSEKVRNDVGWRDKRQLFSVGIKGYRIAYEQAVREGHSNVLRVKGYVQAYQSTKTD